MEVVRLLKRNVNRRLIPERVEPARASGTSTSARSAQRSHAEDIDDWPHGTDPWETRENMYAPPASFRTEYAPENCFVPSRSFSHNSTTYRNLHRESTSQGDEQLNPIGYQQKDSRFIRVGQTGVGERPPNHSSFQRRKSERQRHSDERISERSAYQRSEPLAERPPNLPGAPHDTQMLDVVEMITRNLTGVLSEQARINAEASAGLHSLVRDVVAASRDLGAATVEGAQMQGLMMKAWIAFLGPGRETPSVEHRQSEGEKRGRAEWEQLNEEWLREDFNWTHDIENQGRTYPMWREHRENLESSCLESRDDWSSAGSEEANWGSRTESPIAEDCWTISRHGVVIEELPDPSEEVRISGRGVESDFSSAILQQVQMDLCSRGQSNDVAEKKNSDGETSERERSGYRLDPEQSPHQGACEDTSRELIDKEVHTSRELVDFSKIRISHQSHVEVSPGDCGPICVMQGKSSPAADTVRTGYFCTEVDAQLTSGAELKTFKSGDKAYSSSDSSGGQFKVGLEEEEEGKGTTGRSSNIETASADDETNSTLGTSSSRLIIVLNKGTKSGASSGDVSTDGVSNDAFTTPDSGRVIIVLNRPDQSLTVSDGSSNGGASTSGTTTSAGENSIKEEIAIPDELKSTFVDSIKIKQDEVVRERECLSPLCYKTRSEQSGSVEKAFSEETRGSGGDSAEEDIEVWDFSKESKKSSGEDSQYEEKPSQSMASSEKITQESGEVTCFGESTITGRATTALNDTKSRFHTAGTVVKDIVEERKKTSEAYSCTERLTADEIGTNTEENTSRVEVGAVTYGNSTNGGLSSNKEDLSTIEPDVCTDSSDETRQGDSDLSFNDVPMWAPSIRRTRIESSDLVENAIIVPPGNDTLVEMERPASAWDWRRLGAKFCKSSTVVDTQVAVIQGRTITSSAESSEAAASIASLGEVDILAPSLRKPSSDDWDSIRRHEVLPQEGQSVLLEGTQNPSLLGQKHDGAESSRDYEMLVRKSSMDPDETEKTSGKSSSAEKDSGESFSDVPMWAPVMDETTKESSEPLENERVDLMQGGNDGVEEIRRQTGWQWKFGRPGFCSDVEEMHRPTGWVHGPEVCTPVARPSTPANSKWLAVNKKEMTVKRTKMGPKWRKFFEAVLEKFTRRLNCAAIKIQSFFNGFRCRRFVWLQRGWKCKLAARSRSLRLSSKSKGKNSLVLPFIPYGEGTSGSALVPSPEIPIDDIEKAEISSHVKAYDGSPAQTAYGFFESSEMNYVDYDQFTNDDQKAGIGTLAQKSKLKEENENKTLREDERIQQEEDDEKQVLSSMHRECTERDVINLQQKVYERKNLLHQFQIGSVERVAKNLQQGEDERKNVLEQLQREQGLKDNERTVDKLTQEPNQEEQFMDLLADLLREARSRCCKYDESLQCTSGELIVGRGRKVCKLRLPGRSRCLCVWQRDCVACDPPTIAYRKDCVVCCPPNFPPFHKCSDFCARVEEGQPLSKLGLITMKEMEKALSELEQSANLLENQLKQTRQVRNNIIATGRRLLQPFLPMMKFAHWKNLRLKCQTKSNLIARLILPTVSRKDHMGTPKLLSTT